MSKSYANISCNHLPHYTIATNKNKVFRTLMYILTYRGWVEYKYKVSEIREEDG